MSATKQAGFTLIELLIAMTISAFIAVMSYLAINQVVTIKTSTEASVASFEKLQRTMWWLEQDFTQLAPRTIQDELGSTLPAYQASSFKGVEFSRIAVYPSPFGVSGLVRIGYKLEGTTLYRLIWPVLDRAPDTVPRKLAVLNNVESFSVRQLNNNNRWSNNWPLPGQSKIALPSLIEVNITIKDQGDIRRIFPGVAGL